MQANRLGAVTILTKLLSSTSECRQQHKPQQAPGGELIRESFVSLFETSCRGLPCTTDGICPFAAAGSWDGRAVN